MAVDEKDFCKGEGPRSWLNLARSRVEGEVIGSEISISSSEEAKMEKLEISPEMEEVRARFTGDEAEAILPSRLGLDSRDGGKLSGERIGDIAIGFDLFDFKGAIDRYSVKLIKTGFAVASSIVRFFPRVLSNGVNGSSDNGGASTGSTVIGEGTVLLYPIMGDGDTTGVESIQGGGGADVGKRGGVKAGGTIDSSSEQVVPRCRLRD